MTLEYSTGGLKEEEDPGVRWHLTGWKYFGNLLDTGISMWLINFKERSGTNSDYARERDVLKDDPAWLHLLAARGLSVEQPLREYYTVVRSKNVLPQNFLVKLHVGMWHRMVIFWPIMVKKTPKKRICERPGLQKPPNWSTGSETFLSHFLG